MDNNTVVSLYDITKHYSENVRTAFEYICKNYNIAEPSHDQLREKPQRKNYACCSVASKRGIQKPIEEVHILSNLTTIGYIVILI